MVVATLAAETSLVEGRTTVVVVVVVVVVAVQIYGSLHWKTVKIEAKGKIKNNY